FRYLTLPWLLAVAFYVTAGARLATALASSLWRRVPALAVPRWLPWTAGSLGVAALAIATTCRGSLSIDDDASVDAKTLRCFRDAEEHAGLQDGLGTWYLARYMNAARLGSDWSSPYVVVQILPADVPQLDPNSNDLLWFDGDYRHGAAKLNFVETYA